MRDFDHLAQYAKEKVRATDTPLRLYQRAQSRKNLIDSLVTVVFAVTLLALSTMQLSSNASVQSPAVKEFIRQEFVASRSNR